MNIVLCDDNPVLLEECRKKIAAYSRQTGKNIKPIPYSQSPDLYDELEQNHMADAYLLDVDMPIINGLQLAQKIHAIDMNLPVLFLTAYPNYAPSAIKVQAFRYLSKGNLDEELKEALDSVMEYREKLYQYACLTVKIAGVCCRIPYDQIQYAQKKGKDVALHTIYRDYLYREDLKKLFQALHDDRFAKVDRGCIVNLDFVEGYTNTSVRIHNVPELPISRRMLPEFKKAFANRWMASMDRRENEGHSGP